MTAEDARTFFNKIVEEMRRQYKPEKIHTGKFQHRMRVQLVNDGPVTLIVDSTDAQLPPLKERQLPPVAGAKKDNCGRCEKREERESSSTSPTTPAALEIQRQSTQASDDAIQGGERGGEEEKKSEKRKEEEEENVDADNVVKVNGLKG
ncbi:d-tyrosyl-trna deacylase [Cystoisospora suis]|uniref:D-aminoacyl-tRNA deacylase n=1 Tax=Cystoisospora suis TaxID=483139 RepID=A0A2C6J791_9APIC|nr:d-tyrosyl-trna deacylase [Cystoisospora suis]